jgi:hypothetical protein
MTTINVGKKLYQQLKQKPDFNTGMVNDLLKTILAGIDSKHYDYITREIVGDEYISDEEFERREQKRIENAEEIKRLKKTISQKYHVFEEFLQIISQEHKISKLDAAKLIRDHKDLVEKVSDRMDVNIPVIYEIIDKEIKQFENEPFEKEGKEKIKDIKLS